MSAMEKPIESRARRSISSGWRRCLGTDVMAVTDAWAHLRRAKRAP